MKALTLMEEQIEPQEHTAAAHQAERSASGASRLARRLVRPDERLAALLEEARLLARLLASDAQRAHRRELVHCPQGAKSRH